MISFEFSKFNIVCAAVGLFLLLFTLVSQVVHGRWYISAPVVALLTGAALQNLVPLTDPLLPDTLPLLQYATLSFCRLALAIQLVVAGSTLPAAYVSNERRSLFFLLGPGMTLSWLCDSAVLWVIFHHLAGVRDFDLLQALAIGACLAPTDPVLCNNIVTGKFAEEHIPQSLRNLILAESGANDGLGYPFLFLALYGIRFVQYEGDPGTAMTMWTCKVWVWTILFSVVYGAAVGWGMRRALWWAKDRGWVDHEYLSFSPVALGLFLTGSCGALDTDDVLAAFAAGCVYNWDDRYRSDLSDNSFVATIDMALNMFIFMWLGASAPWGKIFGEDVAPFAYFVGAGAGILVLRRLPVILALKTWIPQLQTWKDASLAGFFGPIGISAMYYLYLCIGFIDEMEKDFKGDAKETMKDFKEIARLVVWTAVISSVVVHGISVCVWQATCWSLQSMGSAITSQEAEYGPLPQTATKYGSCNSSQKTFAETSLSAAEQLQIRYYGANDLLQFPQTADSHVNQSDGEHPSSSLESFRAFEDFGDRLDCPDRGEREPLLGTNPSD